MKVPRMSAIRVAITSVLCALAPQITLSPLAREQSAKSFDSPYQRPIIDRDVLITVTVSDQHARPVVGLPKESFSVLEKKAPEEITFFSAEDPPASVALLFDLSGSMTQAKTARAAEAIHKFAVASNKSNHYLVIGFNTRTQLFSDWCGENDLQVAWDGIVKYVPRNNTALYDACDLVVRRMQFAPDRRRVIIIISDGIDNDSKVTFAELRLLLGRSDVMIYAVGLLSGTDVGNALGGEGPSTLADLASVTGGKAFFPGSAKEFDETCKNLALELAHQYVIGFKPSSPPDNKFHEIKIKVTPPFQPPANKPPRVSVRYRATYLNH
jgi:Ca-activated chloride channel family protein